MRTHLDIKELAESIHREILSTEEKRLAALKGARKILLPWTNELDYREHWNDKMLRAHCYLNTIHNGERQRKLNSKGSSLPNCRLYVNATTHTFNIALHHIHTYATPRHVSNRGRS